MSDTSWPPSEHPDLLGLLRGELSNLEVARAAEHLDICEACRGELSEVAVGHALLTRAGRTLGATSAAPRADGPGLPAAPVPPARLARWRLPLAAAAAVAVLVGGTAVVTSLVVDDGPGSDPVAGPSTGPSTGPTPTPSEQSAPLEPVGGRGAGQVRMVGRDGAVTMTVETSGLPSTGEGEFYYAWLLDPDSGKMLALGVVGPGGEASFEIPDRLVERYQVVDVSLERDDGDPGHSVTSVLRGSYADPGSATS